MCGEEDHFWHPAPISKQCASQKLSMKSWDLLDAAGDSFVELNSNVSICLITLSNPFTYSPFSEKTLKVGISKVAESIQVCLEIREEWAWRAWTAEDTS